MEIDVKFSLALPFFIELSFFLLSLLASALSYLSFVESIIPKGSELLVQQQAYSEPNIASPPTFLLRPDLMIDLTTFST